MRILLLLLSLLAIRGAIAQSTNTPTRITNPVLIQSIRQQHPNAITKRGKLRRAAHHVTKLDVSNLQLTNIDELFLFPRLDTLIAHHNNITSNISAQLAQLSYIDLSYNKLKYFNIDTFWCTTYLNLEGNLLEVFPYFDADIPLSLRYINVSHNKIRRLVFRGQMDTKYYSIQYFNVSYNLLGDDDGWARVPLGLDTLIISHNQIQNILAWAKYIDISHNRLTKFGVFWNAEYLDCSHNFITEQPSNIYSDFYVTNLKYLNCSYNSITQLHLDKFNQSNEYKPSFLVLDTLFYLNCSNNKIITLTIPLDLQSLDCSNNPLSTLSPIPPALCTLRADSTLIQCLPFKPQCLATDLPICE